MKIEILDVERLIAVNKLQEVTSPLIRSNKMMFDPNGLLSTEIFGISKDDRRSTFAYIDLHRHYIHPHIYSKVLKGMFKGIVYIVAGQKYYSVKNGLLAEDPENGWTGVDALYEHWNEIDWSKSTSANVTSKKLLTVLPRDQVFISKELVCPPAYRDVMLSGAMDSSDYVNELNDLYQQLIRSVSLLSEGGLFSRTQYATQAKVQNLLVEIMNYFKSQIKGKHGLIRQSLMGKSVDNGVRAVISAPTYGHEHIGDNIIDIEHSALPISMCCSLFYPFIEAWLHDFFTREVINDPNLISFYDESSNREYTAPIKDPDVQFSERNIKKMINDYCLNPDNRYRLITADISIPQKNGTKTIAKATMVLKGKKILPNNINETLHRAMTLTDVLYLACVDTCEKRHIMVSRYPVGTDKGLYFNKIRVQSTLKHVRLIFNGKEYPFYPDIDFRTPHDMIGVQYVDTLVLSNSHCEGMGADYDGDVLSIRGIYSDEANMEADGIMNTKMSALNITGANAKVVSKEVYNTLYELTKNGKTPGKKVAGPDVEHLLSIQPDDITLSYLVGLFADMVDDSVKNVNGKHKSKYDTWDTMTVPAGYFYKGQAEIQTTIGRFIVNKFMFQGAGIIEGITYFNEVLNKNSIGYIDDKVGRLYLEDTITRAQFNSYLDHRDTIGYWLNGVLAHTISAKMTKPLPEVEKKKAELCKKYEKELAEGNIDVMTKISDELVAYAKELLKDDPGMDLYNSGDLNFGNNYKNNSILKGAVYNKITGEFDFVDTSFMDGIEIKDVPAHANSILASQYPASVATQDSGYAAKKILALLQMMEIDEPGTDCGTKNLIPINITKTNSKDMLYTYIQDGSQEVMLTADNISKYIGKRVMMRSPMSCINDKICSKCAGKLFYLLGVKHAGLFGTQVSHSALNLGLKAKHDSVISLFTLDPDKIVEDL